MQDLARFSLARRLLFPYSGENSLSTMQGLRVVVAWVLLFSVPMALIVLILTFMEGDSLQGVISSVVFAFLSGAFIFGILSSLVVVMSNRSARIRQAWKARNGRS